MKSHSKQSSKGHSKSRSSQSAQVQMLGLYASLGDQGLMPMDLIEADLRHKRRIQ